MVDFEKGNIHIVQGRRKISHQRHQEERNLENIVLGEIEPADNLIIPGRIIKIDHKGKKPQ